MRLTTCFMVLLFELFFLISKIFFSSEPFFFFFNLILDLNVSTDLFYIIFG